jgi:antitoxin component YwqK of YwqJK toxin-antitoxin module
VNPEPGQLRVPAEELDYDGDLFYTYKGEAFTGVAYEEVPGKWLSEVSYRDGLQEGAGRDWYPSGTLKSESWYRENALHGFSREYNEDQVKVLEEVYEYGILVRRTRWDDACRMAGTWVIDPDGQSFARLQRYRVQKGWPEVT